MNTTVISVLAAGAMVAVAVIYTRSPLQLSMPRKRTRLRVTLKMRIP